MEELVEHSNMGEQADVESNPSIMLELNGSINNEARHAPRSTKDSSSKTAKDMGCETERISDRLSNENMERTSSRRLRREDEAKLSSSLRMLFSKDDSDEEDSQISVDRNSPSEWEEEVIAIDDMEKSTCLEFWCELGCSIIIFIVLVSSALITLIIIYLGWRILSTIALILLVFLMLSIAGG